MFNDHVEGTPPLIGQSNVELVTVLTAPKKPSNDSLDEMNSPSMYERRSRSKSVSFASIPKKRTFSSISRSASRSHSSKKQRTQSGHYEQANTKSSSFDFKFRGRNKSIGSKSIKNMFRSRSPNRRMQLRQPIDPLTPFKEGQISWPFQPRYYRRSCAHSDMSEEDEDDDEVFHSKYVPRPFRANNAGTKKRLIDKLNGKSFVLDREPSPGPRRRHKHRRGKRPNVKPERKVWMEKYEEIAQRDAEAEARILAMAEE